MKRKLIKQGGTGLTLYLPKKWADSYHLHAGDEVEITPMSNQLLISTNYKPEKKESSLKVTSEYEPFIRNHLNMLYRLGNDRIKVDVHSEVQKKICKQVVEDLLLGFEVTEESKNTLIIENVTEPSEEKQEVLLRKIFLITNECFLLLEDSFAHFSAIEELTTKAERYDNFCRRNLCKQQHQLEKLGYHWQLFHNLNLVLRNLFYFGKMFAHKDVRPLLKPLSQLQQLYYQLYTAFTTKDFILLQQVRKKAEELQYKTLIPLLQQSKGQQSLQVYSLLECARLVYLTVNPVAALIVE